MRCAAGRTARGSRGGTAACASDARTAASAWTPASCPCRAWPWLFPSSHPPSASSAWPARWPAAEQGRAWAAEPRGLRRPAVQRCWLRQWPDAAQSAAALVADSRPQEQRALRVRRRRLPRAPSAVRRAWLRLDGQAGPELRQRARVQRPAAAARVLAAVRPGQQRVRLLPLGLATASCCLLSTTPLVPCSWLNCKISCKFYGVQRVKASGCVVFAVLVHTVSPFRPHPAWVLDWDCRGLRRRAWQFTYPEIRDADVSDAIPGQQPASRPPARRTPATR